MAAGGHFGSLICTKNNRVLPLCANMKLIGEFMTQLETPQTFEHFYTKWPPEAILFFPINAKNHEVLII